eukprot:6195603-Pleurochrysis_carterae.AAC.2
MRLGAREGCAWWACASFTRVRRCASVCASACWYVWAAHRNGLVRLVRGRARGRVRTPGRSIELRVRAHALVRTGARVHEYGRASTFCTHRIAHARSCARIQHACAAANFFEAAARMHLVAEDVGKVLNALEAALRQSAARLVVARTLALRISRQNEHGAGVARAGLV